MIRVETSEFLYKAYRFVRKTLNICEEIAGKQLSSTDMNLNSMVINMKL